jgi:hypothetical protein
MKSNNYARPTVKLKIKSWQSGEAVLCWFSLRSSSSQLAWSRQRGAATASKKSLSRLRRQIENARARYRLLVTLTYPAAFPSAVQSKLHLKYWAQGVLRRHWASSVLWVQEYQVRGAPHYHAIIDGRFIPYQKIAESWHQATDGLADVAAGTRIERIRTKQGAAAYLTKYLSKHPSKTPSLAREGAPAAAGEGVYAWTGRVWGVYGDRSVYPMAAATRLLAGGELQAILSTIEGARTRLYAFPGGLWIRNLPADLAEHLIYKAGIADNGNPRLARTGV